MNLRRKHVIVVVALAVAGGLAWWVQRPGGKAGVPATQKPAAAQSGDAVAMVEVATIQAERLVDDTQAVGTLLSRQSVMLRPEVSGRVASIAFADGSAVRKGQVLLQLDATLQQAELSQAQAQLSIARANHKRNEELVSQNFVTQRVLDESRANLQVAEAQVQLAQARLARMRIVAPFDGVIGIRNVHPGDYVKDGADLVRVEDMSFLYVDFRLPERYQSQVSKGLPVQLRVDAMPDQNFTAKVLAVDPLIDANGRALLVRAQLLGGSSTSLRPGMFARVTVVFSVNESALLVPEEAIVPQSEKQLVFKLEQPTDNKQANPVARQVQVKLGLRRAGKVQVIEGLNVGDQVVVAGQQRLRKDGVPVRVLELQTAKEGQH